MSDLVFVADVHLVEDDAASPPFHRFLRSLAGNTRTCVIVGDLFNVWIARRRFTTPAQHALLETLREVSRQGVDFKYVEGNRDYFVAETWLRDPFVAVATRDLVEEIGAARLRISHGDLVNEDDRQYRAWRAFSRSLPVRAALRLVPARSGQRLANRLEQKLRGTNLKNKMTLPEKALERCLDQAVADGHNGVVLGHFHQERTITRPGGTLWVLPDWRADRRYLRFDPQGRGRFVAFPDDAQEDPAIRSSASS